LKSWFFFTPFVIHIFKERNDMVFDAFIPDLTCGSPGAQKHIAASLANCALEQHSNGVLSLKFLTLTI